MISSSIKPTTNTFEVVLDEPYLYMNSAFSFSMVRGEVITNFPRDIKAEGPISLVFEGIQKSNPWRDSPVRPVSGPLTIDKKLHTLKLTLPTFNSDGIIRSGTQRFPFEFPISNSFPATIFIKDRIEIFYKLTATLKSTSNKSNDLSGSSRYTQFASWSIPNKKTYVSICPIRISKSIENIILKRLNLSRLISPQQEPPAPPYTPPLSMRNTNQVNDTQSSSQTPHSELNTHENPTELNYELHDVLSFSLTGKSVGNLSEPFQKARDVSGIRYKIGVDRTAVALGGRIGISVMVEPTSEAVIVKSIALKIDEIQNYAIDIPRDHAWAHKFPKILKWQEKNTIVLKWGYGYKKNSQDNILPMLTNDKNNYVETLISEQDYGHSSTPRYISYLDSDPKTLNPSRNFEFKRCLYDHKGTEKNHTALSTKPNLAQTKNGSNMLSINSNIENNNTKRTLSNLKEINQIVNLGERFNGQFMIQAPDCSHIVNPSIIYESVEIKHWLKLVVTIECNGEIKNLDLETPCYFLDCRLVNDDEYETIIPSPPAYQPNSNNTYSSKSKDFDGNNFWEQRQNITTESGWGTCPPCPCKTRKIKVQKNQFH